MSVAGSKEHAEGEQRSSSRHAGPVIDTSKSGQDPRQLFHSSFEGSSHRGFSIERQGTPTDLCNMSA